MKKFLTIILAAISLSFASYGETPYTWDYVSHMEEMSIQAASANILETNKNYTAEEADKLARLVFFGTKDSPLEFSYVLAIMKTESRFNPNARSYCGAMGLMQIMPNTFVSVAKKNDLPYSRSDAWDIEKNIKIGVLYLESLYERYGKLDYVSAGYNGGPGTANRYIKREAGHSVSVPQQTLAYVKKVKKYHNEYKLIFGEF